MTEFERRQLTAIRSELNRAHAERTAPIASANVNRIPNSFIRHESDLTRFLATRGSKLLKPEVRERFFDAETMSSTAEY